MVRSAAGKAVVLTLATASLVLAVAAIWVVVTGHLEDGLEMGIGAVAVGGVALLAAQMSRSPRIDVETNDGVLAIRFHGWDRLWALRREVRVPLRQVERVEVRHVESMPFGWWRHRGTFFPGVIQAGSFVTHGHRELWDVRQGADAVDVELDPSARFRRLVLEVPDPSALARQLETAAGVR